jgi:hypothetical protein
MESCGRRGTGLSARPQRRQDADREKVCAQIPHDTKRGDACVAPRDRVDGSVIGQCFSVPATQTGRRQGKIFAPIPHGTKLGDVCVIPRDRADGNVVGPVL